MKFTHDELVIVKAAFKELASRSPSGHTIDKKNFLMFLPLHGLHGERLFDLFDVNHDHEVDESEFINGLASICKGTFDEKVHYMFGLYDINERGAINSDELLMMLMQLPEHTLLIVAKNLHETSDILKTNSSEMANASSSSTSSENKQHDEDDGMALPKKLCKQAFNECDLDHDGNLSYEQFKLWIRRTPEVLYYFESVFPTHPPKRVTPSPPPNAASATTNESITKASNEEVGRQGESSPFPEEPPAAVMNEIWSDFIVNEEEISHPPPACTLFRAMTPVPSKVERLSSAGSRNGTSKDVTLPPPLDTISSFIVCMDETQSNIRKLQALQNLDLSAPVYVGTLSKYGHRFHLLQSRVYLMHEDDNILYHYHDYQSLSPSGMVFLEGCFINAVEDDCECQDEAVDDSETELSTQRPKSVMSQHSTSGIPRSKSTGCFPGSNPKKGETERKSRKFTFQSKKRYGIELITSEGGERGRRVLYASTLESRDKWLTILQRASHVLPFDKKYEILSQIGEGRFCTVHKCRNVRTGELFAVKVIEKGSLSQKDKELLRSEVEVLKLVRQPHIIRLEGLYETRDQMYIVLELVQGGDLFDRVHRSDSRYTLPLSEVDIYQIAVPLMESIYYLHSLGVIHRDIKPENILIGENLGDIKICDFGVSTVAASHESMTLTCGTLAYVAPEVLTGDYGREADVWSLGVILYYLRSGYLPFEGMSDREVAEKIVTCEVPLYKPVWKETSAEFVDLVKRLLSKDSRTRFQLDQFRSHPWFVLQERLARRHVASPTSSPTPQKDIQIETTTITMQ